MASPSTRAAGYIIAAILILFGILFLMSARAEYTTNPGGRIVTGLVMIGIGIAIVVAIKASGPRPNQKVEIVQKVELSGSVKAQGLKCQQCGATLDSGSVSVQAGAIFVKCPYCKSQYQITEEPKW